MEKQILFSKEEAISKTLHFIYFYFIVDCAILFIALL